jgi:hypothetical protein
MVPVIGLSMCCALKHRNRIRVVLLIAITKSTQCRICFDQTGRDCYRLDSRSPGTRNERLSLTFC